MMTHLNKFNLIDILIFIQLNWSWKTNTENSSNNANLILWTLNQKVISSDRKFDVYESKWDYQHSTAKSERFIFKSINFNSIKI